VWLIPVNGGEPRLLPGFTSSVWTAAFSPDGRLAAAGGGWNDPEESVIRIWDLESGDEKVLGDAEALPVGTFARLRFSPDGRRLFSCGWHGIRVWSLEDGSSEIIGKGSWNTAMTRDGRFLFATENRLGPVPAADRWAGVYDLESGDFRRLASHTDPTALALDRSETILITGSRDGALRAGPVSGEEPHLLLGHQEGWITSVAVSPDGHWIASASVDGTVRLWPMPDMEKQPFHTLPHDELLDRLRALTNLRAVPDEQSPTGYTVEAEPFPGWATVPTW
jgi:WD40 repeat protein